MARPHKRQHVACFVIELTVANAAALYYTNEFNVSAEKAAAIASIFGLMAVFSRRLGGICTDLGTPCLQ